MGGPRADDGRWEKSWLQSVDHEKRPGDGGRGAAKTSTLIGVIMQRAADGSWLISTGSFFYLS